MKLQQLVYATKVAECGSVAEAARRLFVTQPSITAAIHELEREVGAQIFGRTNKDMTVSEEWPTLPSYDRPPAALGCPGQGDGSIDVMARHSI